MKHKKEILHLYILFSLAVFFTYKAPSIVNLFFQIILLISFWRSKRDYFWFAFVLIVESNPGDLFLMTDKSHSFSLIVNSSLGNLYFWMIFTLVAFFKALKINKKINFFLNKEFMVLGIYLIFLFGAFGIYRIPPVVRMLLPWLYLFILPRLMGKWEDYYLFFNLIFAFVPIVLLMQLYTILFGGTVSSFLGGMSSPSLHYKPVEEVESALRPWGGIFIPWIAILGVLLLSTYGKNNISKKYLNIILSLSIFSIFITATRSWLLASIFLFIGYNIINSFNPLKLVSRYFLPVILLTIFVISIPFLKKQVELAFMRYETVQYLINGDITAGGTLKRFDVRGPRVMNHFYESPIIGWGYGMDGASFADGHVGHQNLLMQTGIIGYTLFWLLWLSFIYKMLKSYKKLNRRDSFKNIPLVLIFFFLGIHIINISAQWFNYLLQFAAGFIICFLFSLGNLIYNKAFITKAKYL